MIQIAHERYKLDNGLRVILARDPDVPVVLADRSPGQDLFPRGTAARRRPQLQAPDVARRERSPPDRRGVRAGLSPRSGLRVFRFGETDLLLQERVGHERVGFGQVPGLHDLLDVQLSLRDDAVNRQLAGSRGTELRVAENVDRIAGDDTGARLLRRGADIVVRDLGELCGGGAPK